MPRSCSVDRFWSPLGDGRVFADGSGFSDDRDVPGRVGDPLGTDVA
jgi:hypothetical protein